MHEELTQKLAIGHKGEWMAIGYFFCACRGTCLAWISLISYCDLSSSSLSSELQLWPLTSCAGSFNFNLGTFLHSPSVLLVERVWLMLASPTVRPYLLPDCETIAPIVIGCLFSVLQQLLDVQLLQDIKQAASNLAWVYNTARVIITLEQGCAACSSE